MRIFVAVWPPDEVVATIDALARPAVSRLRWTRPEQWHVTLRYLGAVGDPVAVLDRLAAIGAGRATAVVGPRSVVLGESVLCLPVAGLDDLAAGVATATADLGAPPEARRFCGHLTLARGSSRGVLPSPIPPLAMSVSWEVVRVVVVASRPGADRSRYEILGGVSLG